jgi:hypothetical protein
MPREALQLQRIGVPQKNLDDVAATLLGSARRDIEEVVHGTDDAFRPEKPGRQLPVMTRRPHDDGETAPLDPNLQGFLDGDKIALRLRVPGGIGPAASQQFDFSGDRIHAQVLAGTTEVKKFRSRRSPTS